MSEFVIEHLEDKHLPVFIDYWYIFFLVKLEPDDWEPFRNADTHYDLFNWV